MRDPRLKLFKNFLYVIWKHLNLPDPTPVQYEIADFLQFGNRRQVIEGFRGVGKSWITSAFVLWKLYWNVEEKILVVSASKQRADDFSTFTLRLIKEVPILKHLTPGRDQRESKIAFDVYGCLAAHAPSVKSAGIFGQISGSRATHIIGDDIEVPNNSGTQDMREKLLQAASEFEAIIVPEGNSRITFLGTPQTEESIYNSLGGRGYEIRVWPARYPDEDKLHHYNNHLAPSIMEAIERNPKVCGRPTDPRRFTEQELIEREMSYGRSGFNLQFMLDTSLSDAEKYPLKTGDLIISSINEDYAPELIQYGSSVQQQITELPRVGFAGDRWYHPLFLDYEKRVPWEGKMLAVDPSGRGSDETAYAVVHQCLGKLYLVEAGGIKGGYDEQDVLIPLAKIALKHKVNIALVESNFGDGMFGRIWQPILQRYHRCRIEEVRHNIQKEKRIIDTLEPVLNSHRLIVDRQVVEKDLKQLSIDPSYSLFWQMTRLTKDRGSLKHDDRVDVLAMAVSYWVESMGRDVDSALDSWKTEMLQKELDDHLDWCVGREATQRNSWITL